MGKKTNLSIALSNTRANQKVVKEYALPLLRELINSSAYGFVVNREVELWARILRIGGYRRKYVVIEYEDRQIPVTATKLYSTKSKCRACGKKTCHRTKNLKTLRDAIKPQIIAFREQVKSRLRELKQITSEAGATSLEVAQEIHSLTTCPLSGKLLVKGSTHVDHITPFRELVEEFCQERDLDLCTDKLWLKKNLPTLEEWEDFHDLRAELQLTNGIANIKKG